MKDGRVVKYENEKTNPNVSIAGLNMDELKVNDLGDMPKEEDFTKQDDGLYANGCVIGSDIADKLI